MRHGVSIWIVSISAAVAAHLFVYWAMALKPASKDAARGARAGEATFHFGKAENLPLFDPRPILLPTEWNVASAQKLGEVVQEELPIFSPLAPVFESGEGRFLERFGNRFPEKLGPREIALSFPGASFKGIGMDRRDAPEMRDVLQVRAISPGDGRELFRDELQVPEAELLATRWPDWQPASFIFHVADSFALNRGGVVSSSGYPEADQLLIGLIRRGLAPASGLPNGPCLVEIGP